jgi:hypothetical protein
MKGGIAAALIVVPLLIAALIAYWPSSPVSVATVLVLPPDVHGQSDISALAKDVPAVLAEQLHASNKLTVRIAEKNMDSNEALAFDAVIMTTLTEDAGIFQLNVQVVSPRTHAEIWKNAYQSPREQFPDMLRAAGNGVRRALD